MKIKWDVSVSKGWIASNSDIGFDREYYFNPLYRYDVDRRCHQLVDEYLPEFDAFYTDFNLDHIRKRHNRVEKINATPQNAFVESQILNLNKEDYSNA